MQTSSSFYDRSHSHIEIGRRTLGILAPADLDELLNVGNFGRHLDGNVSTSREVRIVKFERSRSSKLICVSLDARATKGLPASVAASGLVG
jgi:hypothetical protein